MNLICEKLDNNNSMADRIVEQRRHAAAFPASFPIEAKTSLGMYKEQRLMQRLHDI